MGQRFVIGQATDTGLKRSGGANQDAIGTAECLRCEDPCPILILADGMGGYFGGEIASRIAVETVKEIFSASDPEKDGFDAVLRECIDGAHRNIMEQAAGDEPLRNMGSTLVLAVPTAKSVRIGNVGDSRAYLITARGEISQISYDHSFVMEQVRAGLITKEEADRHPRKNVLTMSLSGMRGKVDPYLAEIPWEAGDTVLICSDGLWGPVPEEQIRSTVVSMEPQDAADRLTELANKNGGPDNISVLIARNCGAEPAPDKTGETEKAAAPEGKRQNSRRGRAALLGLILILVILGLLLYFTNNKTEPLQSLIRDGARFFSEGGI